jgi:hypothetical protein
MSLKTLTTGLIALAALATIAGAAAWRTIASSTPTVTSQAPAAPQAQAQVQPQPQVQSQAPTPTLTPTPAQPARTVAHAQTEKASATPEAAAPAAAPVSAGQQAFIDPKTGQLRPAEHDDVAQLNRAAAGSRRAARTATAAAEPQQFFGPDGSIGAVVPDELQPFTVATKTPDGGIVIQHVTGPTQAAALVRANSAKAKKSQTNGGKEEPNDR